MQSIGAIISRQFSEIGKPMLFFLSFAQIAFLGFVDYHTGFEISFALFYLFPVAFVTWFAGANAGLVVSIVCAVTWHEANRLAGEQYSTVAIPLWNMLTRLGFFIVVTLLLSRLQRALQTERSLARTDFMTGALSARAFYELAAAELERMRRYPSPLTLVYIDADNFKAINDTYGHSVGDTLLKTVATTISRNLRAMDRIARLGGDEFAILLPDTGLDAARTVIAKLRQALADEMQRHDWAVTFSIGSLSCTDVPSSVDDLIKQADDLMYRSKNTGKDRVTASTFSR